MTFQFFGTPVRVTWWSMIMVALFANFGLVFFGTAGGVFAGIGIGIVSLLIHERMHVAVGDRFDISCGGIVLLPFGAVSLLASTGHRARETFLIAFAGPLSSALLALGFFLATALFPETAPAFVRHFAAFGFLLNASWAIFNTLPMYPLDGGRMTHAVAWAVTGDERQGRAFAMRFARGTILALGALGVVGVAAGFLDLFSFLWFGFIAWFLWQAGSAERNRP